MRITEDEESVSVCENCKRDFHVGDCFREHGEKCRMGRNKPRSRTVKPKKKTDNLKNSRFVEKPEIDYF